MKAKVAISSRPRRRYGADRPRVSTAQVGERHGRPGVAATVAPEPRHEFASVAVHEPRTASSDATPALEAEVPDVEPDASGRRPQPDLRLLLEHATSGQPIELPHCVQLEQRFGRPLGHIDAFGGLEARAVLERLGANAATFGQTVLFAESTPDLAVVAHEVAHTLQSVGSRNASVIATPAAQAEAEAERVAQVVAAEPGSQTNEPVTIVAQLPPGQVALQRTDSLPGSDGGVAVLERSIESPSPSAEEDTASAEPARESLVEGTAGDQQATMPQAGETDPAAGAEGAKSAEFELPPAPEPGITAEDVAEREAALAEAEAALAGATDAPDLMKQFATIPPTIKARRHGQLADDAGTLVASESQQFQDELPEIHATLNGEVAPAEQLAVESPPQRDIVLESTPPQPAPEPDLPDTPDPGHFSANENVTRVIDRFFGGAETADRADQVGESLREVSTTDPEIPRSPGLPPTVPLEGESDPERLDNQEREAIGDARGARDDAHAAVLTGPGPERSQPVQIDDAYSVEELNQPVVTPVPPAEGAEAYLAMGMPPEVGTAFDQQQQQAMEASMAGAVAQTERATVERDDARQTEVESTHEQAEQLSRDADSQQRDHVTSARETIQSERQTTLDAQSDAVAQMEADADVRRREDHEAIETRVGDDHEAIENRYTTAESDISMKIADAESEAKTEKREAEKAAEEESWWDRAVSFVRQAFNALVSAINAIFDVVRGAINDILDATKAFAMDLIDAVAGFIKNAIALFVEFLKFAVDNLLGAVFPGLAAALNQKIDEAVGYAQGLVDSVADTLKAGVAALVDGLKAGLNRILDIYQGALNVALSLVKAALTGDWSALARKLLEAVLKVIGVDPEAFYVFIGRAEETFQLILDDPVAFLGNVVDAVLGGVRRFADNILTHLQSGIIGWLTGTLGSAGLTLPERFDLMGVLSLAQQILGLTWERLRQKAVRLIGEENVARLEHVFGYIETLVREGWGGLWERIQTDVSTLRDQVLDGIKSFLMERVIFAAITKIASLFNPVGAVVQIVLTAWNLFTFLRDQLARIFQVVQTVIDAIGDIARGVLEPGMAKVEQVLGSLMPLALDLLARLLGLGNVGAKVREIIERIQATIDRAIDSLIARVLAAFSGRSQAAGPVERQIQEEAASEGVVDVEPGADPNVKSNALDEAHRALRDRSVQSVGELHTIVGEVYQRYKAAGLKSLAYDITNTTSLAGDLIATASAPAKESIRWDEVVDPDEKVDELAFKYQSEETIAAITVNRRLVGRAEVSNKRGHAEQNIVQAHWQSVLDIIRASGEPSTVILAINRSPCNAICAPLLQAKLLDFRHAEPELFARTRFILAPTGQYWPADRLTQAQIDTFKEQLRQIKETLGPPGRIVIERHLERERFLWTTNITSAADMVRLGNAGWEHRQLLAGRTSPATMGNWYLDAIRGVSGEVETTVSG